MTDIDFSIQTITEEQAKIDEPVFTHNEKIDWLSYVALIIHVVALIVFLVFFFTHRHHYSIQKTLNKKP